MVLAFCSSLYSILLVYQISFIYLQYFRRYGPDKLTKVKLEGEITLKLLVIEIPFLHSALPLTAVYQCIKFHLIPFYTFQRYAPDKLFTAKIKKGSNSINTGYSVMVLAFCNSPHGPLLVYQVSLNYLQYFYRYALDKSVTDGRTKWQLHSLPSESIEISFLNFTDKSNW